MRKCRRGADLGGSKWGATLIKSLQWPDVHENMKRCRPTGKDNQAINPPWKNWACVAWALCAMNVFPFNQIRTTAFFGINSCSSPLQPVPWTGWLSPAFTQKLRRNLRGTLDTKLAAFWSFLPSKFCLFYKSVPRDLRGNSLEIKHELCRSCFFFVFFCSNGKFYIFNLPL